MTDREKYDAAFTTTFGVDGEDLGEGFTFAGTQQWNSLAHLELVAVLEDAFDIFLEPDEITHFESYEHGKEILRAHGVEVN